MADPVGAAGDWVAHNVAIIVGVAIGTAAKYGLTLTEGRKLSWFAVGADMLMLSMICVLAIEIADWFSLAGNARVLAGALSAVSSDRLIRLARDRFLRKAESDLGASVSATQSTGARVPAGNGVPGALELIAGTDDTDLARTGSTLRSAYRSSTRSRPPADQIDALKRLDASET